LSKDELIKAKEEEQEAQKKEIEQLKAMLAAKDQQIESLQQEQYVLYFTS
jgi:hypothetical protein